MKTKIARRSFGALGLAGLDESEARGPEGDD